jgi:hypothetical protein
MSLDATRWAWDRKGLSSNEKLVLLCLADMAGYGDYCWPSQGHLCRETGLHVKTVRRVLDALSRPVEADGFGLIADSGRRTGRTRQVIVWRLVGVPHREAQKEAENCPLSFDGPTVHEEPEQEQALTDGDCGDDSKGAQNSPLTESKGDSVSGKGALFSSKGGTKVPTEPTIEPTNGTKGVVVSFGGSSPPACAREAPPADAPKLTIGAVVTRLMDFNPPGGGGVKPGMMQNPRDRERVSVWVREGVTPERFEEAVQACAADQAACKQRRPIWPSDLEIYLFPPGSTAATDDDPIGRIARMLDQQDQERRHA